jgi:hypothetical protein
MKLLNATKDHALPLVLVFVLVSIYFAPLYSGKRLVQSDDIQLKGVSSEYTAYLEKGERVRWNNREFSGIPLLSDTKYNPFYFLNTILYGDIVPKAVMMVFSLFVGFYTLLQVFGISKWMSSIGSFAFAFSSFNILSLEAGHDNKVLAIAFMAPVLAGIVLAYRGKLWSGGLLTFLSAGFQLLFGHVQITYYLLIIVLAYLVCVVIETLKTKNWTLFLKASSVLIVASLLALGCNFVKLYTIKEYGKYSTRGGSELNTAGKSEKEKNGLDKDYALAWSNGKSETFTIIFPYFHGGASGEELSKDSNTYRALSSRNVDQQTIESVTKNIPLYWGTQPFTAGPVYFGIILCFAFLLSLFVLKDSLKWWGIALCLLSFLLAMGKNLEWFTDLFFYNFPLYNKFRSVTMILSIAQLVIPLLGMLALQKVMTDKAPKQYEKPVLISAGILLALGIFFLMFKGAFFDFTAENDTKYGFPDWLVRAIVDDRADKFNADIFRGILFLLLAVGALLLYLRGILKLNHVLIAIGLLVLIDLWSVDKRYLGKEDFQNESRLMRQVFQPTPADEQIMKDKSYFRVFNLTRNPFSDGVTSYFHYSVGGYNAVKLQRYQDLIDQHLSQMTRPVINMLNVKYFIGSDNNKQVGVQQNPDALGNSWLVKDLIVVKNADEEIAKLKDFDPASTATVDDDFTSKLSKTGSFTGSGKIALTSYHPENMKYSFESAEAQFAIFSEIFYEPGWQAYVDGQKANHVRVNYVLRGMEIPAGKHEIVFKYEPYSSVTGNYIVIGSSVLSLLFIAMAWFKRQKDN